MCKGQRSTTSVTGIEESLNLISTTKAILQGKKPGITEQWVVRLSSVAGQLEGQGLAEHSGHRSQAVGDSEQHLGLSFPGRCGFVMWS